MTLSALRLLAISKIGDFYPVGQFSNLWQIATPELHDMSSAHMMIIIAGQCSQEHELGS